MLALFDFPDPNAHSAGRAKTTTPLQKLFILNGPFMVAQADKLAKRVLASEQPDDGARIESLYWNLFGRAPLPAEKQLALEFLSAAGEPSESAWSQFTQVLLASNEMFTID